MKPSTQLCLRHAASLGTVVLAFSGGKDSVVCLDLLRRAGVKVWASYWYTLPDLECEKEISEIAMEMGCEGVSRVPHPVTIEFIRSGRYGANPESVARFRPGYTNTDAVQDAIKKSGAEWVANGSKMCDSPDRRCFLKPWPDGIKWPSKRLYPLKDWKHREVLAYLTQRKLRVFRPKGLTAAQSSEISLLPKGILMLYDHYRDDFRRLLEVFPNAGAVVARRAIYQQNAEDEA